MKRIFTVLVSSALLLCSVLSGCASTEPYKPDNSDDLMRGIEPKILSEDPAETNGDKAENPTDFAVRLFKDSFDSNENTLISPVSVLYALALTANGAKGETLSQMESVLGMTISELNSYLKSYADALPEGEKYKLNTANSIWFTDDDDFTVNQDFLQTNADYYGADIYKAPFDESSTLEDINSWVEDRTDGMIKNILDEVPQDAVMYLINALCFDAEWEKIYNKSQISDGTFTAESGEQRSAEMMYSNETDYLEDENASGFIKYYADSKYAFAALLPDEGISLEDYIQSMTGEKLSEILSNPQKTLIYAAIPKFESEYSSEMSKILEDMGMTDAFDANSADFSGLGTSSDGNIFINRVIHKTYISVDEKGTKAGAATAVETADSAAASALDPKEVILDRPFVYMIIDCEAKLPLFIGAVTDLN